MYFLLAKHSHTCANYVHLSLEKSSTAALVWATASGLQSKRAYGCWALSFPRKGFRLKVLSRLPGSDVWKDEDSKTYMCHHVSMHITLVPGGLRVLKSSDNLRKWGREVMGGLGQEPAAGWRSKPGWMRGTRGCRGGRNMKEKIFWSKFCLGGFFLTVGVKNPNNKQTNPPKPPLLQNCIVLG